jgi:hypothetical protein
MCAACAETIKMWNSVKLNRKNIASAASCYGSICEVIMMPGAQGFECCSLNNQLRNI